MRPCLLLIAAIAAAAPAAAAERSFTVTGFDRIRVDGPYMVRLTTGVSPYARAKGSPSALDGISVEVQGQTLIVRKAPGSSGGFPGETRGPVEIAIGTHELSRAWLNGDRPGPSGTTDGLAAANDGRERTRATATPAIAPVRSWVRTPGA